MNLRDEHRIKAIGTGKGFLKRTLTTQEITLRWDYMRLRSFFRVDNHQGREGLQNQRKIFARYSSTSRLTSLYKGQKQNQAKNKQTKNLQKKPSTPKNK